MNHRSNCCKDLKDPDDPDHILITQITIIPDYSLFTLLNQSAEYMQITKEELVLKILKVWEKNNHLPLQGKDRLCSLIPDNKRDPATQ